MNRAFTLTELLVVISLMAVIAGFSALAGSDSYQRTLAIDDTKRIIEMLYRARTLSQANVCRVQPCMEPRPYGVHIGQEEIFLFEGNQFDASVVTESHPLSAGMTITSTDISFLPRSARSIGGSIKVRNSFGKEYVISVNQTGAIFVN